MSNDLITEDMVAYTRNLARRLCRSRPFPYGSDVVGDMVGIGFVVLIQAARSYDERHCSKATFKSYATRAILNRIRSELGIGERNSKYKHLPRWCRHHFYLEDFRRQPRPVGMDLYEDIDHSSPPPEYAAELADEYAKAKRLLARLTDRERTVFMLYHADDMSGHDIARLFGVSHNRVFQLLKVATRKLREAVHASHP